MTFIHPVRQTLVAAALGLVFVAAAELTARVEDFFLWGTPLWVSPDHDRDLVVQDGFGVRGKPDGRYKKWHLNHYGFRNGPMTMLPQPGVIRVMVLGASETFGLGERNGKEYPAQLQARLDKVGRYEVVNAAVAGLSVVGLNQLWDAWGVRFEPAIVLVYPTPAFYLDDSPPRRPIRRTRPPEPFMLPELRLVDALKDRFEVPPFIQKWRVKRRLAAVEASHSPDWLFRAVPTARLDQFTIDLGTLLDSIKIAGAQPILMTHAIGFHTPLTRAEADEANQWRVLTPRATAEVLVEFDAAAAAASRDVAASRGVPVIDLARRIGGQSRLFAADLHHFSEEGAGVVASLAAEAIARLTAPAARPH